MNVIVPKLPELRVAAKTSENAALRTEGAAVWPGRGRDHSEQAAADLKGEGEREGKGGGVGGEEVGRGREEVGEGKRLREAGEAATRGFLADLTP